MFSKMAIIRAATEEDIPRILELYDELLITTATEELKRSPVTDDVRQAFAQIQSATGHELLVVDRAGSSAL